MWCCITDTKYSPGQLTRLIILHKCYDEAQTDCSVLETWVPSVFAVGCTSRCTCQKASLLFCCSCAKSVYFGESSNCWDALTSAVFSMVGQMNRPVRSNQLNSLSAIWWSLEKRIPAGCPPFLGHVVLPHFLIFITYFFYFFLNIWTSYFFHYVNCFIVPIQWEVVYPF